MCKKLKITATRTEVSVEAFVHGGDNISDVQPGNKA